MNPTVTFAALEAVVERTIMADSLREMARAELDAARRLVEVSQMFQDHSGDPEWWAQHGTEVYANLYNALRACQPERGNYAKEK